MSPAGPKQEALPFTPRVEGPSPYRPSAIQDETARQLRRFAVRLRSAPSGLTAILLAGPAGAGKTRMVEELQAGANPLDAARISIEGATALEVFAEINRAAAARLTVILEARKPAARWIAEAEDVPPDVVSRLTAIPELRLERPGPEALEPPLAADLACHGLRLEAAEISSVAKRLPRTFAAPRLFCRALDSAPAALSRRDLLQWGTERVHLLLQYGGADKGD